MGVGLAFGVWVLVFFLTLAEIREVEESTSLKFIFIDLTKQNTDGQTGVDLNFTKKKKLCSFEYQPPHF